MTGAGGGVTGVGVGASGGAGFSAGAQPAIIRLANNTATTNDNISFFILTLLYKY